MANTFVWPCPSRCAWRSRASAPSGSAMPIFQPRGVGGQELHELVHVADAEPSGVEHQRLLRLLGLDGSACGAP